MAAPVQVARQQTTPELSGTFWTLASDPIPTLAGTLRNPPELSEPCLWILHQHAPELSGTLQNLPRPSGTNLSEPSGTYLQNLRQHTPEPSGTFRNPAPEPAPAHAGTLRNLPEPSSGTCSCDPHQHTPVLIWAEDPISLRCWGKIFRLIRFGLYKKNYEETLDYVTSTITAAAGKENPKQPLWQNLSETSENAVKPVRL